MMFIEHSFSGDLSLMIIKLKVEFERVFRSKYFVNVRFEGDFFGYSLLMVCLILMVLYLVS